MEQAARFFGMAGKTFAGPRQSPRILALEAGFTDPLAKSVDPAALLQKVATLTQDV
jgi:hypothetical protein